MAILVYEDQRTVSRSIELPEEVYRELERKAREKGLTPEEWIAATLGTDATSATAPSLFESVQDLLGIVDSTEEPQSGHPGTPFAAQP